MMKKIRILLVDDHALIREGINALLHNVENMEVVGEASDGIEAVNKNEELSPDIILMDIMMPNMNGLEAARLINKHFPGAKMIFLSMEVTEAYISDAIQAGAVGYLPKDIHRNILIEAIKKVYKGEKYFSTSVSQVVFQKFYEDSVRGKVKTAEKQGSISKREEEVLKLIASGLSNKEIADLLFISGRTVDAHRNHIMQKLSIHSTADLVKYAIKNELISI